MIYTLGFFLSYSGDSTSVVQGGYRIHAGEDWVFPKQFRMAGADGSIVSQVSAMMGTQRGLTVNIVAETNDTAFQALCETEFNVDPNVEVCIYLDSLESYAIFYGGADFVSPFDASLAGAQWAVSSAMLNVSGYEELYPVRMTQRVPQLVNKDTSSAPTGSLIVPGLFLVLSSAVMLMFIMAPLTNEKLTEVVRSFVLVGVKLRTYMLSWVLYYSINGLITAGGLVFVSIGWKTYPQSNAGLIFLSHYLGLVGIYSQFTFLSQLIEQEELAQGIPWLVSFAGMAVGVSILILQSPSSILMTIVAAISPTVGMLQYSAIYVNYEASGFDTGIHPGDNVASSGLLGNIIAQVVW
jgi:ABC-2 family transporter protein